MIATVRIAPVERWCEGALQYVASYSNYAVLAGMQVEILTESMKREEFSNSPCKRSWEVSEKSDREICEILDLDYTPGGRICEGMLEMD